MRDKVTDLIFRARVVGQAAGRAAPTARRRPCTRTRAATASARTSARPPAIAGAPDGGGEMQEASSRRQGEAAVTVKPIVREAAKVGRNDPCPCGSGKKYKKCCGVGVA